MFVRYTRTVCQPRREGGEDMRIYDVNFGHVRHGEDWSRERVSTRGYVPEAIAKAIKRPGVRKFNGQLRVVSVDLVASTRGKP